MTARPRFNQAPDPRETPFTNKGHFDQGKWELYHVDEDRSESTAEAVTAEGELGGLRLHRALTNDLTVDALATILSC